MRLLYRENNCGSDEVRYVFVTRMFSGLYETIRDREWKPSGIPTFIKLVEKIALRETVAWFVVCRTKEESSVVGCEFRSIVFKDRIRVFVIPYKYVINSGKVNAFFTTLFALYYIVRTLKNINGRLFYFDRSNIVIAGVVKAISSSPVVIRVLGLYPDQKSIAINLTSKLLNMLTFMAYKKKYDLVICTQDGSGGEYYIDKLINRSTKRIVLLNGVDKEVIENKKRTEKIIFLFVGTLTNSKGILELIEVFLRLKEKRNLIEIKIIGKGKLTTKISSIIQEQKVSDYIKLLGSVKHDDINQYYSSSDIYISLNKLGNLSNTVLEAMAAGKCIIMLGKDERTRTDETTEKLVPEDVVISISRNNIVNDLAEILIDLTNDPEKISIYSKRMQSFANNFLWSWDERMNYEIELLEKIAKGEPIEINSSHVSHGFTQNKV